MNEQSSLIMENRNRISVSGVTKVYEFDENSVNMQTLLGRLVLKGENIMISSFDTETGDVAVTGEFSAAVYMNDEKEQDSFFKRLFR